MEAVGLVDTFWSGKRVFLTGHTGFKGAWLALWLSELRAEVFGFSLPPPTQPNFFSVSEIEPHLAGHALGDIRDFDALLKAMQAASPDVVIHMAAQPLVRYSYRAPIETYATNVMGTAHVLEAVREVATAKASIIVTTDKCYANREWVWPYRETDTLGGYDPYASSKACAELVTDAYRQSFLEGKGLHVASARAGNVIGGGDWAADRLVPDFFRALESRSNMVVRSPKAIRPWQHVLEPISGYLVLARNLFSSGATFSGAWNFGPNDRDSRSVGWVVEYLSRQVAGSGWQSSPAPMEHEAMSLKVDSAKARQFLRWKPRWNLETALDRTCAWYKAWQGGEDMRHASLAQISAYMAEDDR